MNQIEPTKNETTTKQRRKDEVISPIFFCTHWVFHDLGEPRRAGRPLRCDPVETARTATAGGPAREKQFNRKVELNAALRALRVGLEALTS